MLPSESLQSVPFEHKNPSLIRSREVLDSHCSRTSEMDSPSDILDKSHEIRRWKPRLWDIGNLSGVVFPACITDTGKALETPFLWASFALSRACRITGKRKNTDLCGPAIHSCVAGGRLPVATHWSSVSSSTQRREKHHLYPSVVTKMKWYPEGT